MIAKVLEWKDGYSSKKMQPSSHHLPIISSNQGFQKEIMIDLPKYGNIDFFSNRAFEI